MSSTCTPAAATATRTVPGAGLEVGDVLQLEDLGAAEAVLTDGLHHAASPASTVSWGRRWGTAEGWGTVEDLCRGGGRVPVLQSYNFKFT